MFEIFINLLEPWCGWSGINYNMLIKKGSNIWLLWYERIPLPLFPALQRGPESGGMR